MIVSFCWLVVSGCTPLTGPIADLQGKWLTSCYFDGDNYARESFEVSGTDIFRVMDICFAIWEAYKKRKTITKSELDNIKGLGSILKMRLMKEFKNIKNIKSANLSDLMTVKGISEKIARNILNM